MSLGQGEAEEATMILGLSLGNYGAVVESKGDGSQEIMRTHVSLLVS